MESGNMKKYLEANPDADRLALVCIVCCIQSKLTLMFVSFFQLIQVAKGLQYLHDESVVHGDLKSVSRHVIRILSHSESFFHKDEHLD